MNNKILFPIFIVVLLGLMGCKESRHVESDALDLLSLNSSDDEVSNRGIVLRGDGLLSLDYKREEIRVVLRELADALELNLIIPEALHGKTSIKLRDVTWRQVFSVVLSPVGYTYIEEERIIKVISVEALALAPTDTNVFILDFARAEDIKDLISPLVDKVIGGRVMVDIRSNALVITERLSQMQKIKSLIDRMDRPTDQILIEAKLFETKPFTQEKLPVLHSPEAMEEILADFDSDKDTRMVSSFSIITLDQEIATFNAVERIKVRELSEAKEGDGAGHQAHDYMDMGILMAITPEVSDAGLITLDLSVDISAQMVGASSEQSDEQNSFTGFLKRSISSKVSIKDGYCLAINSMSLRADQDTGINIPEDESAPESLMRMTPMESSTRQYVLLVSAKTLNPLAVSYEETIDPRVLHEMGISDDDIPGCEVAEEMRKALKEIRGLRDDAAKQRGQSKYQAELDELRNSVE